MWRCLVVLVVLGACAKSSSVQCGDIVCSSLSVCVDDNRCVLQTQIDACAGKPELASCTYPGESDGICSATVCVPAGCGNGVIEPGELCDDGNHFGGDGCSANCKSKEVCGDGAVDPIIGETCDNGDANSDARETTCHTNCQVPRCGDKIVDPGEFCDDGNTTPGDGCNATCTGRWTTMPSGTFSNLNAVWATPDGSVAYAVGGQGTILRYDRATNKWSRMTPPGGGALQGSNYTGVWGISANDVYICSDNYPQFSNGRVDHWDGTSWSVSLPNAAGQRWSSIWASAASGPRVIGINGNDTIYATLSGTTWTVTTLVAGAGNPVPVRSLFSPDNGTTMFATDVTYKIYTCSGAACANPWTTTYTGKANVLWGSSLANMFGYWIRAVTLDTTNKTATDISGSTTLAGDTATGMSGVAGTPGEIVVVGPDHSRIAVFDGTTWEASPPPIGTPFGLDAGLFAVFSYAVNKAFIVGANGTILY